MREPFWRIQNMANFVANECVELGYPEGTVYILPDGQKNPSPFSDGETMDTHSINDPVTNSYAWGSEGECERWLLLLLAERAKGNKE